MADYDWVVFTSANAVERFVPLLRDARAFGAARVAAIGPGTAEALAGSASSPTWSPSEFVAESLVEAFPSGTGRVLLPRAAVARDVLPDGLRAKGWTVDVVEAYRTAAAAAGRGAGRGGQADAITFTSSSTVTSYLEVAGRTPCRRSWCASGRSPPRRPGAAGLTVDVGGRGRAAPSTRSTDWSTHRRRHWLD